jgi:hypothetical protein
MSCKHRQKFSGEFSESDSQVCVCDRLDGEVAATDDESGLLPERSTRVNVPSACTGKHATKLGHGTAAQERVDSSEDPNHKDQPAISQVARNLTWCTEDASADRISNTDSKAEAHPKYAQQVATATCPKIKDAAQRMLVFVGNRLWQDFLHVGHSV